jgi:Xaa-Pro aminopeptidase
MGLSFESVSSTGPNAAIIHYAPTKNDSAIINPDHIYLIDSGG